MRKKTAETIARMIGGEAHKFELIISEDAEPWYVTSELACGSSVFIYGVSVHVFRDRGVPLNDTQIAAYDVKGLEVKSQIIPRDKALSIDVQQHDKFLAFSKEVLQVLTWDRVKGVSVQWDEENAKLVLEDSFHHFPAGTDAQELRDWFESRAQVAVSQNPDPDIITILNNEIKKRYRLSDDELVSISSVELERMRHDMMVSDVEPALGRHLENGELSCLYNIWAGIYQNAPATKAEDVAATEEEFVVPWNDEDDGPRM